MSPKIIFALLHWGASLAFLVSAYGWGTLVLAHSTRTSSPRPIQEKLLQAIFGIALIGTAFVYFTWLGQLTQITIFMVVGAGLLLAIKQISRAVTNERLSAVRWPRLRVPSLTHVGVAALAISVVLPLLLAPLSPPNRWDEVMYHLPHAREWAHTGTLTVNEWLRYPWAPFNLNVIYAAAMMVYDDIMPRTLHAMLGLLCATLIWTENKHFRNRIIPGLGALIWISVSRPEYNGATIDLGLCLFLLTCFISACRWVEDPTRHHWLHAASFSAGMALGIKYQAIIFVLPYAIFVLLIKIKGRISNKQLIICFMAALAPCALWYTRNWIMTGNPINPLAPSIFGYYDWNQADMDFQLYDLRISKSWPPFILLPALFSPLVPRLRKSWFARAAYTVCVYAFIVWYFTSHHARYLMPAYPLLSWLSAATIVYLAHSLWRMAIATLNTNIRPMPRRQAVLALAISYFAASLLVFQTFTLNKAEESFNLIATSPTERDEVLKRILPGYAVARAAKDLHGQEIYQFGMENYIYFFPRGTRGDHFGPWRYRDMSSDPQLLAKKMEEKGLQYLAAPPSTLEVISAGATMNSFFQEIINDNGFKLFLLTRQGTK